MTDDLFPGFASARLSGEGLELFARIGGRGPPLLLLHGYPECHATWARVAPALAARFTCVIPDLRGYGASDIPAPAPDHAPMSKRTMAREMAGAMRALGFPRYCVVGHDRGARVAYRMALDAPEAVARLGIVEVAPTGAVWDGFDADQALRVYHWPFLAQPHPLPETLIAANPDFYIDWTLKSWSRDGDLSAFDPRALALYRAAFRQPERVRAMCEDYRAGATLDRAADRDDWAAAKTIAAPVHLVMSRRGLAAGGDDPAGLWRHWAPAARAARCASP